MRSLLHGLCGLGLSGGGEGRGGKGRARSPHVEERMPPCVRILPEAVSGLMTAPVVKVTDTTSCSLSLDPTITCRAGTNLSSTEST